MDGVLLEHFGDLLLAAMLGACVGLERQLSHKAAGLRTQILIAVGSTLWTQVAVAIAASGGDPARIPAQIASGIGFIGGGAILVSRGRQIVHGMTTAASIWAVAALGVAVGMHAYGLAISTASIVLITLIVLGRIEARFFAADAIEIRVETSGPMGSDEGIEAALRDFGLTPRRVGWRRSGDEIATSLVASGRRAQCVRAIAELRARPHVVETYIVDEERAPLGVDA